MFVRTTLIEQPHAIHDGVQNPRQEYSLSFRACLLDLGLFGFQDHPLFDLIAALLDNDSDLTEDRILSVQEVP